MVSIAPEFWLSAYKSFEVLGLESFFQMTTNSVASSSFYLLASTWRLLLFSLLAIEMGGMIRMILSTLPMALGVAGSVVYGLACFLTSGARSCAMDGRLTSLFLN